MEKLTVKKILVPAKGEISLSPAVRPENRITEALEVMLKNDLKEIAVIQGDELLGIIRLEDALKMLGLDGNVKSKEAQSVVVHGRKIVVE